MPVAGDWTADDYAEGLQAISDPVAILDPGTEQAIREIVERVEQMPAVTRESLAQLINDDPDAVPVLASVVGLSQERLKRQLQSLTGSPAWVKKARTHPREVIDALDGEFGLIAAVNQARYRAYTLADVLIARASRGAGASGAITAGRGLEDAVQEVIEELNLDYDARTRYVGTGGQTGPADFAIPEGGAECRIAIGVKGFDSTGSKLTAAYDEVRRMADARRPDQYLFAVVDGVGWHARRGDLDRLVDMVHNREIDGIFSLAEIDSLRKTLRDAAVRVRLLAP